MRITIGKAIELASENKAIGTIILSAARSVSSRIQNPQESEKSIANNWWNPEAEISPHEVTAIQDELVKIARHSQLSTDAEFLQSTKSKTPAEMTTPLSTTDAIDVWRRVARSIEFD